MLIKLICVGKLKEDYYEAACAEFIKRLSRFCTIQICEVADEKASPCVSAALEMQIKDKEGARIIGQVGDRDYLIALDLNGKQYSSTAFADKLRGLFEKGRGDLAFVIGGSTGLSPAVTARADECLKLSEMTFPHRIARLILLEQLYRAFKIWHGEPYHK